MHNEYSGYCSWISAAVPLFFPAKTPHYLCIKFELISVTRIFCDSALVPDIPVS